MMAAVMDQTGCDERLEAEEKLECRYPIVGSYGGARIYNVESNKELNRLLAMPPVDNFLNYQVRRSRRCPTAAPPVRHE